MSPEAQTALQEAPSSTSVDPRPEVRALREALNDAVRALERCGLTPAKYARLPPAQRDSEVWRETVRVWRVAGVEFESPDPVILRFSDSTRETVLEYPSPQVALEAAITAIELNEAYPVAIEVNGRCLMDRASILRAWEDRHDPG